MKPFETIDCIYVLKSSTTDAGGLLEYSLFPFAQYWWAYAAFLAFVLLILVLDLGVFHKNPHAVTFKESAIWSAVWISLALLFNWGLYYWALGQFSSDPTLLAMPGFDAAAAAKQVSLEFLAGYLIEKSLAVDNIFVFIVVFGFFAVPLKLQHRVLFFGILGALFFRAIFIALGSYLMEYAWVLWVFGAFLVFTGLKLMFQKEQHQDPSKNWLVRWLKNHYPVTEQFHGAKFFVKQNGKWFLTPLFLTLAVIEVTDIIFAVDSVPAIFAVTKEPFIVFTSNIFAILGLRSLYFMLAGVMDRFFLLKYGLGLVLIFVGLKMTILNKMFDGHFPIVWSLGIIVGILATSIGASLIFSKSKEAPKEN